MGVITEQQVNEYRDENTREVELPDGSKLAVRMPPLEWSNFEFLKSVEGISERAISAYALEETGLQDVTFDQAFRMVVVYLANRWN